MKDLPYITIGRFSVLFIILLLSTTTIAQNREMKEYNVDSTLYVYYQQCKANIQSPIVLPMSDTLFTMAQTKSDPRMQAVALSTKLDYYYFKGQEDSIIAWVERVKKFAQETEQSKYYYFAWGKRLILFYIKNGKFNTALYEAQNMLREAQQEDNKEGIAYCYDCIGDIYILKRLRQQAIDAKLKAIEIIETYHLNAYNLHSKYMSVAKLYNDMLQPQKANDIIKKAEKLVHNNNQAFEQKLQYVAYYLRVNQLEKAQKALEEAEELFKHDKTLINRQKNLIVSRESYYKQTKQYQKALQALEEQEKLAAEMGETQLGLEVKMRKGQTYYWMRQKDLAADYLYDYINLADSINNINEQAAITEFSSLLNFEKIKIEKKELELKAKEAELKHNRSFILLLVSTLFIVFILFYREFYLNKKLKHSKKLLLPAPPWPGKRAWNRWPRCYLLRSGTVPVRRKPPRASSIRKRAWRRRRTLCKEPMTSSPSGSAMMWSSASPCGSCWSGEVLCVPSPPRRRTAFTACTTILSSPSATCRVIRSSPSTGAKKRKS